MKACIEQRLYTRAKLNSLLNYVDKGQNKEQIMDKSTFVEKRVIFYDF